jgi:hypothetical protein
MQHAWECVWCGQEIEDRHEEAGGEAPAWATPDGDYGCDGSPWAGPDGCGGHVPLPYLMNESRDFDRVRAVCTRVPVG